MIVPGTRRRGGAAVWMASLAVLSILFSVGACSSGKASSDVSASDAADTVTAVYGLPDEQRTCLEQHFDDRADARRVFSGQGTASKGDLDALGEVVAACIPTETLAAALTGGVDDGFGNTLTDAQKTCLTDGVEGLDEADRNTLLVGLAVASSGTLDDAGMAEMGQVTSGLMQTCQLDVGSTQTVGPTG